MLLLQGEDRMVQKSVPGPDDTSTQGAVLHGLLYPNHISLERLGRKQIPLPLLKKKESESNDINQRQYMCCIWQWKF